jgi:hypothetical protein
MATYDFDAFGNPVPRVNGKQRPTVAGNTKGDTPPY